MSVCLWSVEICTQLTNRVMNRWYLGFHPRFSSRIHTTCTKAIAVSSSYIVTYFHGANVEISIKVWCFWAKSVRLLYVTSNRCKIIGDSGQKRPFTVLHLLYVNFLSVVSWIFWSQLGTRCGYISRNSPSFWKIFCKMHVLQLSQQME